jgi:anhydro-N-acetylmuramic acid kinase
MQGLKTTSSRAASWLAKEVAAKNTGAKAAFIRQASSSSAASFVDRGITYRQIEKSFDSDVLYQFNKEHGSTPHNFIPDGPVREHLSKVATGETVVWGAFSESEELVGFITGEKGGGYWLQTAHGEDSTCFINEFVVDPKRRGLGIGANLTKLSVDMSAGIFGIDSAVKEMYTTVHVDNVASRAAFIKGGYEEVITYADKARDRDTTVLKFAGPKTLTNQATMRVVGLQSGNAVDGLDVGVFEFTPAATDPSDPRALSAPLEYKVLANKTYPFTPEQRQYVLGLRAMNRPDGNDYAVANYRLGEWFADAVNNVLAENNIDKSTVHLIGSHGQTISGHPHWELGDLSVIAQQTGITVAGDFRPADVGAGGNGTPVTCTYDSIMLRPAGDKWRVAINIGGTASVTFCPPQGSDAKPIGLDPGIGVFFQDLTTQKIDPTLDFDDDGKMARSGVTNEELLAEFLDNKYYHQDTLPIGVGPDDFPETLFHKWYARAQELGVSDVDLLSTFVELTARQIALSCKRFGGAGITDGATDDVLLRGGICNNSYFVERLQHNMSEQLGVTIPKILTLEDVGLDEDAWENAMYAMMGYLCYNNMYNFVPTCTGASRHVVGGRIAPGENFAMAALTNLPKSAAGSPLRE